MGCGIEFQSIKLKNQHKIKDPGNSCKASFGLEEELSKSLSPSPFSMVDNDQSECMLKELVNSDNKTLLSIFYEKNINTESSQHWRKVFNDHIFFTLQSICIIKKLKPIPEDLLARKSISLSPITNSKFVI